MSVIQQMRRPLDGTNAMIYLTEYAEGSNDVTLETIADRHGVTTEYIKGLSRKYGFVQARRQFRKENGVDTDQIMWHRKNKMRANDWRRMRLILLKYIENKLDSEKHPEVLDRATFMYDFQTAITSLDKIHMAQRREDGQTKAEKASEMKKLEAPLNQFNNFGNTFKLTSEEKPKQIEQAEVIDSNNDSIRQVSNTVSNVD